MWTGARRTWTQEAPERGPRDSRRDSTRQFKKHNMLRCDPPGNHYILWFSA